MLVQINSVPLDIHSLRPSSPKDAYGQRTKNDCFALYFSFHRRTGANTTRWNAGVIGRGSGIWFHKVKKTKRISVFHTVSWIRWLYVHDTFHIRAACSEASTPSLGCYDITHLVSFSAFSSLPYCFISIASIVLLPLGEQKKMVAPHFLLSVYTSSRHERDLTPRPSKKNLRQPFIGAPIMIAIFNTSLKTASTCTTFVSNSALPTSSYVVWGLSFRFGVFLCCWSLEVKGKMHCKDIQACTWSQII